MKYCAFCGTKRIEFKDTCPRCSSKYESLLLKRRYCEECGTKLEEEKCPNCEQKKQDGKKKETIEVFCPRCGKKVESTETVCPNCLALIKNPSTQRKYCEKCGARLTDGVCLECKHHKKEKDEGKNEKVVKYCPRCGERLDIEETICPKCLALINNPYIVKKYCGKCGQKLVDGSCSKCKKMAKSSIEKEKVQGKDNELDVKHCPVCGKELSSDAVFCSNCFSVLVEEPQKVEKIEKISKNAEANQEVYNGVSSGCSSKNMDSSSAKVLKRNPHITDSTKNESASKELSSPPQPQKEENGGKNWVRVAILLFWIGFALYCFLPKGFFSNLLSGDSEKQSEVQLISWTYKLDDSAINEKYSATVRIYEQHAGEGPKTLWISYEGDDIITWTYSKNPKKLSFSDKMLFYDKTVDGIDYYTSTTPAPFDKYMWALSGDRSTLFYCGPPEGRVISRIRFSRQ